MSHKDIYEKFKKLFPAYAAASTEYFPNGKGSIRVRLGEQHRDFVFTIFNSKEWIFETINSYLERLKNNKK